MKSGLIHLILVILIVLISFLIFYRTTGYDFVADDWQLIYYKYNFMQDWGNLKSIISKPFPAQTYEPIPFYRPMITLVNFLNLHILGKKTFAFHIVNLGFHILNALLLYFLIFLLFKRPLLSFLSALFFSAHPIHTNSVVWVSGRTDVVACLFVLLTLILFLKRKDHSGISRAVLFWAGLFTYSLALLSKELALALPLFLFVWDHLSEREPLRKKIIPYIPFVVVTIIYITLRVVVIGSLGTGDPYTSANLFQRFLTAFAIYFYYFKKLLFPVYLNFSPRVLTITSLLSLKFWGALIFFAVVLSLGLTLRKVSKEISFGILWILITLVPVLNLVPLYASVKEWWAYIPSLGFCLILGRLAELGVSWERKLFEIKLPRKKTKEDKLLGVEKGADHEVSSEEEAVLRTKARKFPEIILVRAGHAFCLFFALLLLFYAFTLQSRARIFRKDYHLWTNTSQIAPYDVVAHNSLGLILKKKGALRWAKMAFEKAVQADPNFADAHNNLGVTLEMTNQDDSALVQIKEAIRLDPYFVDAYNNLGIVYGKKAEYDSAIAAFKRAIRLDPTFFPAYKNLGLIYSDKEDFARAMKYLSKALELAPSREEADAIKGEIDQIRVRGYR